MPLRSFFVQTFKRAFFMLISILPMLLAVIGLVGMFEVWVTPSMIHALFSGHAMQDTLIGTAIGGVAVGQPYLSYIIGGELLQEGISRYAVTAFILSFVTLGVVQLPLEVDVFGWRFTLLRNVLAVLFAILVAFATVLFVKLLG